MNNPVIQRELIGALRSRKALAMQVGPAVIFALLVILRWPSQAQVDLTGSQAQQVFRVFAYGLLTTLLLLVPVFPATTIVREKLQGTLALLLNSPMSSWSIYFGKLVGVLGLVLLPLVMSLPAAAACYAMGGLALWGDVAALYLVLVLMTLQYAALGLYVSTQANSVDAALRATYALVLLLAVVVLGPYQFLQGKPYGPLVDVALWLRSLSPIPAVMEIVGHADAGAQGMVVAAGSPQRFALLALVTTALLIVRTAAALKQTMLDRPRAAGVITDDRKRSERWFRRLMYLVDPQRRKRGIAPLVNPVMVKEFRSRRFGRLHWMLRLVATCALLSLLLTFATAGQTIGWGTRMVGGVMVLLQVALIVLITPSLAAGLISSERESGGWALLQMTPLSAGRILRGKLLSVIWTLLLILLATLPGYVVLIYIEPVLTQQVLYVLVTLLLMAVLALVISAMISSFYRRTAPAMITAYTVLATLCGGTMLFWLGRDAPFGHQTVQAALLLNPMATALNIMEVPGFAHYDLRPTSWWLIACGTLGALVVLRVQTWRLTRPR